MPLNNQSLVTRIYEDIVIGAFSFGAKLGEEQLVERYNAKRHVLREAFGQLEELGFVEHVPNRGVFVREPHPQEFTELFEIRELLEIHAAKITALPVPQETLHALRSVQERHSAAARAAQFRKVLHLNSEFHRIQYSASGNQALASAIETYAHKTHLVAANKFGSALSMEAVIEQHLEIIEAMAGDDHERLKTAIRAHFDMDRVEQYRRQYFIRHGEEPRTVDAAGPNSKVGAVAIV